MANGSRRIGYKLKTLGGKANHKNPVAHSVAHRVDAVFTDYIFPVTLVIMLVTVGVTSSVGFNLWVISGPGAAVVAYCYAVLITLTMFMQSTPQLHAVGAVVGAFVLAGRAGSFLEVVIVGLRYDLIGSIFERIFMLVAVVSWHSYQSWRATALKP